MGFVRFLLWTSMCIALGIFIGTWELDGKTPAQHFQTMWSNARKVQAPTEKHTPEDRAAIERIISKRKL